MMRIGRRHRENEQRQHAQQHGPAEAGHYESQHSPPKGGHYFGPSHGSLVPFLNSVAGSHASYGVIFCVGAHRQIFLATTGSRRPHGSSSVAIRFKVSPSSERVKGSTT